MALRALTPGKAAYCSECGAETAADAETCADCKATFDGFMDALLCPICNGVNRADATTCGKCEARFPEPGKIAQATGETVEQEYLRRILRLSREKARARDTAPSEAVTEPPPAEPEPRSLMETGSTDALEREMWRLAEPFDRMLQNRRRRLEQMESLIGRARKRIKDIEGSENPIEVRERDQLKRQIEELLLEKEDILKLEEGLVEMENTYRSILRLQQEELKSRESSLHTRLDAFRHELEVREHTMGKLRERESDMVRKEDEFRRLINRLHEREKELNQREELLREKARLLDERHHALSGAEVDLERRRWDLQMKSAMPPAAAKGVEPIITVPAPDADITDVRTRLTDLEEQMERVTEEKRSLARDLEDLASVQTDVKSILKVLDDLLGQLPDDKVRTFAKSDAFALYEKILDRLQV